MENTLSDPLTEKEKDEVLKRLNEAIRIIKGE